MLSSYVVLPIQRSQGKLQKNVSVIIPILQIGNQNVERYRHLLEVTKYVSGKAKNRTKSPNPSPVLYLLDHNCYLSQSF